MELTEGEHEALIYLSSNFLKLLKKLGRSSTGSARRILAGGGRRAGNRGVTRTRFALLQNCYSGARLKTDREKRL